MRDCVATLEVHCTRAEQRVKSKVQIPQKELNVTLTRFFDQPLRQKPKLSVRWVRFAKSNFRALSATTDHLDLAKTPPLHCSTRKR